LPGNSPVKVELVPLPVEVNVPGIAVSVQVPVAGKPLRRILPVATVQLGCVNTPNTGEVGVEGCVLMTTFADTAEMQPVALVTVNE
jgi:hypothetical protein